MLDAEAVWLITGCSTGFGRALARQALAAGYRVAATARVSSTLDELIQEFGEAVFVAELDVTRPDQVKSAVKAVESRFGNIDVLVNNAGYGYVGAIEEGEDADVRAVLEANLFGSLDMIKAVLPGMRERRRGHVVNMSSVGGITAFPAVGYYHMAKFAVEGLSETLAKEVAPFGIGVMLVEPGGFRTDFRGRSMKQSGVRLPAYAATAGKARDSLLAAHGKQRGDPTRGARAIIAALEAERPPLHLVLGGDALDLIRKKIAELQRDLDTWEALTRSTDFGRGGTA